MKCLKRNRQKTIPVSGSTLPAIPVVPINLSWHKDSLPNVSSRNRDPFKEFLNWYSSFSNFVFLLELGKHFVAVCDQLESKVFVNAQKSVFKSEKDVQNVQICRCDRL